MRELKRSDTVYLLRYAIPWNILYPDRPLKTPPRVYEDLPNVNIWIRDRDRGIGTPLHNNPGTDRGGANFLIASMHAASWNRRDAKGLGWCADQTEGTPNSIEINSHGVYDNKGSSIPVGTGTRRTLQQKAKRGCDHL